MIEFLSGALMVAGGFFFFAGTVGLVRFPDVYSRLHALAKADNLGLGCVLAGLALQADSLAHALKLLAIWPLALAASAGLSYAIGRRAFLHGVQAWQRRSE